MMNFESTVLTPRQHRKDPPKGDGTKLRIKVVVNPRATTIPGVEGRVPHGEQIVEIWACDLDHVKLLVEDRPELLKQAEVIFNRELREHLKAAREDKTKPLPDDPSDWPEYIKKMAHMYTETNVMAEFNKLVGRERGPGEVGVPGIRTNGMRPLASLEVLDTIPAPEAADHKFIRETAAALAGHGSSAEVGEMRKEIEGLKATIEELLTKPDPKTKGSRKA